jgi:hypothetical protein
MPKHVKPILWETVAVFCTPSKCGRGGLTIRRKAPKDCSTSLATVSIPLMLERETMFRLRSGEYGRRGIASGARDTAVVTLAYFA